MGVKKYRPVTPSLRFTVTLNSKGLSKKRPERKLTEAIRKTGGRNSYGRVTARFRGGGHKRRYRHIDFRRDKDNVAAVVEAIEYDPNRTANIALLNYADGEKRYIVAPEGLVVGDTVLSGEEIEAKPGNAMPLKAIPLGTMVHNIELRPGRGAKMVRSAGLAAELMSREGRYAHLKLPSGEVRKVLVECRAVVGQVGNAEHESRVLGKAGRKRWLGRRPHNRGVAMNPVDHPMGGGEGRSSGGRHPCSPWGQLAKGYKTRKPSKSKKHIVKPRTAKR
ncbi:MAG: 50S ribosomal protein L2 [Verrucomicrobia bacterium]|nr:50S ribosomal protein L2 [Verrucomicrobiota bacterium]